MNRADEGMGQAGWRMVEEQGEVQTLSLHQVDQDWVTAEMELDLAVRGWDLVHLPAKSIIYVLVY